MIRRTVLIVVWALALLGLLLAGAFGFAQTELGQRLIAEQLGRALSGADSSAEVSGLRGLIPFDFRVDQVRLADAEGPWLELDDLRVSASPGALLRGRFEIDELSATRLTLHRLPPGEEAAETEPLAELPTSLPRVIVRSLAVDQLEVGEAVLGENATFRLSGGLGTGDAGRTARLTLDLERTDEDTARASLEARLDLGEHTLALDLSAADTGGLLAGLTGRSGAGDFRLDLSGEGPLENWEGDLRAAADGLARADARIALAITDTTRVRLDGQFEPAAGVLPAPADALVGERLQLTLMATLSEAGQLAIDELRATTALMTLTGSGHLNREAERLAARGRFQIRDLAPLGGVLGMPVAGALDVNVDLDGPLMQPEGRLRLTATDLAASAIRVREVQTTFDLAMLERLDQPGARLRVKAQGNARQLRLPPDVALPAQDVAWQAAFSAPVDRTGTVAVERLAVSADHLRLTAQGSMDAATLGGDAQVTLALEALAPFAERYGRPVAGAAELDATIALGAGAELISIDLYGRTRELSGLPEGVGELVGTSPTLEANAILVPDESIEVTHLRLKGSDATLDGKLDVALPGQALDGALTLDLPRLAPLSPLLGVDVDGSLNGHAQLGGTLATPAIQVAAQSPDLLVAGEHIDALAFSGKVEGTGEAADGQLRLAVTSRGMEAELASGFALRMPSLRLTELIVSAPRTRIDGALSIDFERQLVEGELTGRIDQLRAFAPLLPVRLAGALDLEARAAVEDGTQTVALAVQGNDVSGDFGRLRRLVLRATVSDPLHGPRIAADLTLNGLDQGDLEVARGSVRAEGTPQALEVTLSAAGDAHHLSYDLDGRVQLALEEPLQVRIEDLGGQLAEQPLSLASPATVTLAGGSVAVDDLSLRLADAQLSAGFAVGPQQVAAQARLDRLPLALIGRFGGPELRGQVAGRLSLEGAADNPSGSIELDAAGVALASRTFADVPSAELALSGTLESRRLRLELRGEGVTERPVRANLELPLVADLAAGAFEIPGEGELVGRVNAELALARLADMLGLDDQRLEGPLRADLTVGGTIAEPALDGTVSVDGGLYENGTTGTVLRDLNLLVTASRRTVAIERFSASDGGQGRLSGEGTIELDAATGYPLDLRLRVQQARILARDEIVATASGELALDGSATGPELGGELTVNRAEISIPERIGPSVAVIPVQEIGRDGADSSSPDGDGAASEFVLRLDLTVAMPNQVFVRGRGLDSEWEGRLQVKGTAAEPRVSGTLQVRRGRFELLGERFDLRRGTLEFTGDTPPNPVLDIEAVAQAPEITAVVGITGQAMAPQFRLDSEPSLPEDEIVSRLLFNRSAGSLGPGDALRLAAAVNTLRGGGLGLLGQARQAFGLDTLDVSGEGLADAEIRAGRYLNDRVFVEVGKGAATDSEDVRIEVEILPNLSLDADTNAQSQSGIGLKWRYDY